MKSSQAIEFLARQRDATRTIQNMTSSDPRFGKWKRDTEIVIERIFGKECRHLRDFTDLRFHLSVFSSSTPDYEFQRAYNRGLDRAAAILDSMIGEVEEFGVGDEAADYAPDTLNLIEKLCLHFSRAARQLQHRHGGRSTIAVEDEYDVQDLLHAILRLHFDDVRAEEATPSYAGGASRVDFLLKAERIVVEVKKTRPTLKDKELGEQLIIDRARYASHPDCDTLVCFVYDPEGRIGNPVGLERDLENHPGPMKVRVIIAPRG
jgi:hypothetical protein